MLFGIRERIFRHKIKSFKELLADAREAENVLLERKAVKSKNDVVTSSSTKSVVRCTFCRKKGHLEEDCFKRKEAIAKQKPITVEHVVIKQKYACYVCGMPGVVRAKCPNCSKQQSGGGTPLNVAFNELGLCTGRDIPMVNVVMFGVPGQVLVQIS